MAGLTITVTKKCCGTECSEIYRTDARDFDECMETINCDLEIDANQTYDEAVDDKSLLHTTWEVEVMDEETGAVIGRDTFTIYDF